MRLQENMSFLVRWNKIYLRHFFRVLCNHLSLGYEESGQSNSVTVEEEGEAGDDGGALDDMILELNSGRYQYGLVGVNIRNKGIRVGISGVIDVSEFYC